MDANPGLRVARTARIGSTPGWFSVKGTSKVRRKKEHSRDGSGTWESGACCRCVAALKFNLAARLPVYSVQVRL